MKRITKKIFFAAAIALLAAGIVFYRYRLRLRQIAAPIPPAKTYDANVSSANTATASPTASDLSLPAEVNLDIPFTSQAPDGNWNLPYQQFCEEASSLMAASYIQNQPIKNAGDAVQKLLAIKDFEMQKFGFYEDTTAEETATILKEYFNISKIQLMDNPSASDIRQAVAAGKAVLVPLAGRQVGNPYYRSPGPLYHMLVVKGYTKNGDFITNDPGTHRGADYVYKVDVIMNAIHDWNGGNVEAGKKVIIIAG